MTDRITTAILELTEAHGDRRRIAESGDVVK